jgi:hypothetical protein
VWIPFDTATLSFLLVSNSKSNLEPEEAIESLKKMRNMTIHYMFHFKLEKNITGYDNKFDGKNKTTNK